MPRTKPLRAIDLYSGVGGWALGLRMAGIDVVASYDHWAPANETNFKNNHHQAQVVDLRRLALSDLPRNIDIVVGSPPCTQFSYSNRGGSGDIDDGLEDIVRFLSIVSHLRPKAWAMENVPRMANVLETELRPKGRLAKFLHLDISYHVINMEEFGLPQRRRRCIAGRFDFELFMTYAQQTKMMTLGRVVNALSKRSIHDPTYGLKLPRTMLLDHETEDFLSEEEERINRSGKLAHPVYNAMSFPDSLNRSVRTITATCTRVSRESIVIENPAHAGTFRRLTIRERSTLQGFPITYQFYGTSYSQKLRMVGNAIPPPISYYLGQSFRRVPVAKLPPLTESVTTFRAPIPPPTKTPPDTAGARFPRDRTFRFAIPSLRLKSGVRFEFKNAFEDKIVEWRVAFIFGTPKSIHELPLNAALLRNLILKLPDEIRETIDRELDGFARYIQHADVKHLQDVWSHRGPGGTRPFMVLDKMSELGARIIPLLGTHEVFARKIIGNAIKKEFGHDLSHLSGIAKLLRNFAVIVAGLLVGSCANAEFARHRSKALGPRRTESTRFRAQ